MNSFHAAVPPSSDLFQPPAPSRRWARSFSHTLTTLVVALVVVVVAATPAASQLTTPAVILEEGVNPPFGPSATLGELGIAQLAADFNGDGFDDLAISRRQDGGRVYIFTGSTSGLTYSQTLTQFGTDDFGSALASCDFDGDGAMDLAVGAENTDIDSNSSAGAVVVYLGGPAGLSPVQLFDRDDLGDESNDLELFGGALAAGDFDGDLDCDLAVGIPGADGVVSRGTTGNAIGEITVLWGLGNGTLSTSGTTTFDEADIPFGGVADTEANDRFGSVLETLPRPGGDLLLVGVPNKDDSTYNSQGRIWVVLFDGQSLDTSLRIDFGDIPFLANPVSFTELGASLAAGRFVSLPLLQFVAGVPGYQVSTGERAGAVVLIALDQDDPTTLTGASVFDQSLPNFGNTPKDYEDLGASVLAGDVDGNGWDDMIIGVPNDDSSTSRGISGFRTGVAHVVYSDGTMFVSEQILDEALAGGVQEENGFGSSLAAGDFFGAGAASVAVAAPDKDDALSRGVSPEESHGVVYVFPAQEKTRFVEFVARTGEPFPGAGSAEVTELSDAAINAAGMPGFRALRATSGSFVAVDGGVVFEDSDEVCASGKLVDQGFALAGNGSFAHLDSTSGSCPSALQGVQFLLSSAGVVADENDLAPGGVVGEMSQVQSTDEERLYFLGTDGGEQRIQRTGTGFAPPLDTVRITGQAEDGLTLKGLHRFDVSDDGSHLLYSGVLGNIADNSFLVLDGERRVAAGDALGLDPVVTTFGPLAVADDGWFLFGAQLLDGSHRVYAGSTSEVSGKIGSNTIVAGYPLDLLQPLAVSAGSEGRSLQLWGEEVVNRGGGSGGSGGGLVLFGNCEQNLYDPQALLAVGQSVSPSPSDAPATVADIVTPSSPEGLELGDDGTVYVKVELERGGNQFDAILGVRLDCAIFADGFESGDTTAWQ